MLYRYPIEQKRTSQEITVGNRRYETDTGAELPPVPYISAQKKTQSAAVKVNNTASGGANKKTSAAKATASLTDTAAQKKAEIDRQYGQNKDLLKNNYDAQMQQAKMSSDDIMRQLYIAYMQGIKNMSQQQALWGAGGEIESLKSRHRTNYEDNRAKQNSAYSGIIGEIQQKYNSDLMALEEKYLKQLMSL